MIAALYTQARGCYYDLPNVDPWGEGRDARLYHGPYPVVAHPPCARWSRYWNGGPSARVRRKMGDDDGCFASALASVRRWGGVLEHPEASHAWEWFGLRKPPRSGGWVAAGDGGWTCCVEQGHYGHKARKMTWLYAYGFPVDPRGFTPLPSLIWGPSVATIAPTTSTHPVPAGRRASRTGACQRMSKRQRAATPPAFRDVLIAMALGVTRCNSRDTLPGTTRPGGNVATVRRTFKLPADVREALVAQAEETAVELLKRDGMDVSQVADLIGEGVEAGLEIIGLPDPSADAAGKVVAGLVKRLAAAVKPDPNKLLKRATEALKAGKGEKAKRLFARAADLFDKQAGEASGE